MSIIVLYIANIDTCLWNMDIQHTDKKEIRSNWDVVLEKDEINITQLTKNTEDASKEEVRTMKNS